MTNSKPCILRRSMPCPPCCFVQRSNLIKPRYNQLLANISRNSDDDLKICVYRIAGAQAALISRFGDRNKPFCVMNKCVFWCAWPLEECPPITHEHLICRRPVPVSSQSGRCQHVVSDDFIKYAFVLPWSAVCGTDLHGHWINKTPLCETMEVSMIRLLWLAITQHVFPPAFDR